MVKVDERMCKISVIVPAYNESPHIRKTIEDIEKVFSNPGNYEILVVDDGSTDNTYLEARKNAENNGHVKVIENGRNGGKGEALKHGFEYATGDLVTFIDADGDLHPHQIKEFMKLMEKSDADVIIGSKRHPLSKIDYPLKRKILSSAYYLLNKILFGLSVKDTQAGLKLFKYDVLKKILPKVLVKKYAFDLELLVNANHHGFKIKEAPIELNSQRIAGRIKMNDIVRMLVDTAAIFYRLKVLRYYDN
jgi:glycosyltransferase involved in cell wall biosynthesis